MGVEVFDDPLGQRIKALMMNYAIEKEPTRALDSIERSVNKTYRIVEFIRQATIDFLDAEADVLCFRQVMGDPVPVEFVSGILHASRVISGDNSIIGRD